jgi:hypothetical protein
MPRASGGAVSRGIAPLQISTLRRTSSLLTW